MAEGSAGSLRVTGVGCSAAVISDSHIVYAHLGGGDDVGIIPPGFPEGSVSRMLCGVFGLEPRPGEADDMFEFLVMLFISDVKGLLRKGLKFAYALVQANETSFKGRMLFSEHIRENLVHKERVFVEYELFSPDRAENRLIKSTLELLMNRSSSSTSRRDIKTLLTELEEIPASTDVLRDLERVNLDRNMTDYISVVSWCEVFLKALSIGGSSGGDAPFAVMVDSDALSAAYVGRMSSHRREDGSFSARCSVSLDTCDGKGSVILVDISWFFYDRRSRTQTKDAELLYATAPGYRVIPDGTDGTPRIGRMALGYLTESGARA